MPLWLQNFLNLILPPRCLVCGKILGSDNGLCEECFNKIRFISYPICYKCGTPLITETTSHCASCVSDNKNPFRFQRSMVYYDDNSRPLIVNFKFHDKTENSKFLARWLYSAGHDIWEQGADILMPVPLHNARLRHRKYNQSALLCKDLSKFVNIPVDYHSLVRHKNTRPQVEFNGKEREHNVKHAFKVRNKQAIQNKRIVIIDDVMTTGSTIKECALELLKNGAQSVDVITIARVVKI